MDEQQPVGGFAMNLLFKWYGVACIVALVLFNGCDLCFNKEDRAVDREYVLFELDSTSIKILDYEFLPQTDVKPHTLHGFHQSNVLQVQREGERKSLHSIGTWKSANLSVALGLLQNNRRVSPSPDFTRLLVLDNVQATHSDLYLGAPYQLPYTATSLFEAVAFERDQIERMWQFGITKLGPDTVMASTVRDVFYSRSGKPFAIVADLYYRLTTDSLKYLAFTGGIKGVTRIVDLSGETPVTTFTLQTGSSVKITNRDTYITLDAVTTRFVISKKPEFVHSAPKTDCCDDIIYSQDGEFRYDVAGRRMVSTIGTESIAFLIPEQDLPIKHVSMNNGFVTALYENNTLGRYHLTNAGYTSIVTPAQIIAFIDKNYAPSSPEFETDIQSTWTGTDGKVYLVAFRSLYTKKDLEPCD
jgi:hypothetical protein